MKKNTLKIIHYYSGLFLALFILMHITNHLLSLLSVENHMGFMDKMRLIYRHPVGETILLIAVLGQIISGTSLIKALKADNSPFLSDKLRIYSGLYLALFLLVHVSAVISGRVVFHLDTNIYFGAAGINLFPFNLFFIPYYFLAVSALFIHIACIHYKKASAFMLNSRAKSQAIIIGISGIILAFLIIMGMTNFFNGLLIPSDYLKIYEF